MCLAGPAHLPACPRRTAHDREHQHVVTTPCASLAMTTSLAHHGSAPTWCAHPAQSVSLGPEARLQGLQRHCAAYPPPAQLHPLRLLRVTLLALLPAHSHIMVSSASLENRHSIMCALLVAKRPLSPLHRTFDVMRSRPLLSSECNPMAAPRRCASGVGCTWVVARCAAHPDHGAIGKACRGLAQTKAPARTQSGSGVGAVCGVG